MTSTGRGDAAPSLTRAAVGGVGWQLASYASGRVFVLLFTAVLARLLTPAEFGLVALALLLVTYVEAAADLGVGHALVFDPGDRNRVDRAVSWSLLTAVAAAAGVVAVAPVVGAFFDRPDVVPLVRALSVAVALSGAAQVPDALLRRDLRFSRRLLTELSRTLVQGATSVTMALLGLGAWAIVWGYIAGQAARAATGWALVSPRPRIVLPLRRGGSGGLLSFGAVASGATLLLTWVHDVDYLIVGRVLGATDLGFYSVAFRVPQAMVVSVYWAVSAVTFPVFARIREEPSRVRSAYLRWVQVQVLYGVPAGLTLAALAPDLVEAVFGPRWAPAAGPLRALSVYAAVRSLSSGAFEVLKGLGRPATALVVAAVALAATVPVLTVAAGHGIVGVAWAQVGLTAALGLAVQAVGCRATGLAPARLARSLIAPLVVGIGAGGTALAVVAAVPGPWPGLVAGGAAGGVAALTAARLLHVEIPDHVPLASRWLATSR